MESYPDVVLIALNSEGLHFLNEVRCRGGRGGRGEGGLLRTPHGTPTSLTHPLSDIFRTRRRSHRLGTPTSTAGEARRRNSLSSSGTLTRRCVVCLSGGVESRRTAGGWGKRRISLALPPSPTLSSPLFTHLYAGPHASFFFSPPPPTTCRTPMTSRCIRVRRRTWLRSFWTTSLASCRAQGIERVGAGATAFLGGIYFLVNRGLFISNGFEQT